MANRIVLNDEYEQEVLSVSDAGEEEAGSVDFSDEELRATFHFEHRISSLQGSQDRKSRAGQVVAGILQQEPQASCCQRLPRSKYYIVELATSQCKFKVTADHRIVVSDDLGNQVELTNVFDLFDSPPSHDSHQIHTHYGHQIIDIIIIVREASG